LVGRGGKRGVPRGASPSATLGVTANDKMCVILRDGSAGDTVSEGSGLDENESVDDSDDAGETCCCCC
jgi:hypothetical protein